MSVFKEKSRVLPDENPVSKRLRVNNPIPEIFIQQFNQKRHLATIWTQMKDAFLEVQGYRTNSRDQSKQSKPEDEWNNLSSTNQAHYFYLQQFPISYLEGPHYPVTETMEIEMIDKEKLRITYKDGFVEIIDWPDLTFLN